MRLTSEGSSVLTVARLVGRRDVGGEVTLFSFDVSDAHRASYVRPGQYANFTVGGESGYFVLGSREERTPWEILLRRGGGVADALHDARIGLDVDATTALGAGYPVDDARGEDVAVVVTAGAMAAARATVGRRIEDGDAARTRLLIGARTRGTLPLQDEIEAMREAGVTTDLVFSREDASRDIRYVEHVLERGFQSGGWVFVAGSDAMIADVRAAALALGANASRVVSNV